MSYDKQLEMLIEQTINSAVAEIPTQLQEIEQNQDTLKVADPKEFVYGIIMGMALGMASTAVMSMKQGMLSPEDR